MEGERAFPIRTALTVSRLGSVQLGVLISGYFTFVYRFLSPQAFPLPFGASVHPLVPRKCTARVPLYRQEQYGQGCIANYMVLCRRSGGWVYIVSKATRGFYDIITCTREYTYTYSFTLFFISFQTSINLFSFFFWRIYCSQGLGIISRVSSKQ